MIKVKLNNNPERGSTHIIIAVTIAVAVILGVLGYVFWQNFLNKPQNNDSKSTTQTSKKETVSTDETQAPELPATITGEVRYPIEWMSLAERNKGMIVPSDFKVCAIDATTSKEVDCDQGFSESKSTYSVEVPTGNYYIRATTGNLNAYYDLYIADNLTGNGVDSCSEEASRPIYLGVLSGDVRDGIDAADFWVGHLGC